MTGIEPLLPLVALVAIESALGLGVALITENLAFI